jgi:preprotein translocase SecE subunit
LPSPTSEETRNEQEKKTLRHEDKAASATKMHLRDNRIVRFLFEAYYELRYKVTWPTFKEARNLTIVVIMFSTAIGAILIGADLVLNHLFLLISGK